MGQHPSNSKGTGQTSEETAFGHPLTLSLEQVANAVMHVGFVDFTFGKVAERLGVDDSTLYRCTPNRDGLVALGLDRLLRLDGLLLCDPDDDDSLGWRELLNRAAKRAWRFLSKYPGVAGELANATYPVRVFELADALGEALVQRGFEPFNAVLALHAVLGLTVGMRNTVEHLDTSARRTTEGKRLPISERMKLAAQASQSTPTAVQRALARLTAESPKRLFERQLAVVLAGIEHSLAPKPREKRKPRKRAG